MTWFRQNVSFIIAFVLAIQVQAQAPQRTLTGEVVAYLANRIGDYDGLRLHTTMGDVQLRFPPHLAAAIRKVAPLRQRIDAGITPQPPHHHPASGAFDYQLIFAKNQTTGGVVRVADLPPPAPQSGQLITTEGPLTGTLTDDHGQLVALLIGAYLVELKPHQRESVGALLTGAKRIGVVGYERTAAGFVNQTGRTLIHPTALTIGGQTFSL